MANPTSLDSSPALVETTSASVTAVSLNPHRQYTLHHTGVDASGNDDANSALPVLVATGADPTADYSSGSNRLMLQDGGSYVVGPGWSDVRFKSITNGDAVVQVLPAVRPHALAE